MVSINKTEAFPGRFGITYKDEDVIYAYDEITHGLYEFTLYEKKVSFLLSPLEIYRYTIKRVQGITKIKNEIILIPQLVGAEWIFYNIEEKSVRFFSPFETDMQVSSVVTINKYLFLIPLDTCNPIVVFSLVDFEIISKYDNWYISTANFPIWGASTYKDLVVFPVVNTKYICCLNEKRKKIIVLNIKQNILSISLLKEEIWILPTSGEFIFVANLKGEIIKKINIFKTKFKLLVNEFNKIIAIEDNVVLLPANGNIIYIYKEMEKKIVQVKSDEMPLQQKGFIRNFPPYWNVIMENKELHLLPSDYNYMNIELDSLKNTSFVLKYGNNINYDEYFKMVELIYRKFVGYENEYSLHRFLQYIIDKNDSPINKDSNNIGKKIWERNK